MALTSPKGKIIDNIINYLRDEVIELKYVNINLRQLDAYDIRA